MPLHARCSFRVCSLSPSFAVGVVAALHAVLPAAAAAAVVQSRCHLAFVTPDFLAYGEAWRDGRPPPPEAELLGIVTMEDVMEQLIQEDIMDEFDGKKVLSPFSR